MPKKKAEPQSTTALAVVPTQLDSDQQSLLLDDMLHDCVLTEPELASLWSKRLRAKVTAAHVRHWLAADAVRLMRDEMVHRASSTAIGQNLLAWQKLNKRIHAILDTPGKIRMRDMRTIAQILSDFSSPQQAGGVQVNIATKIELPTHLSDKELLEVAVEEVQGDDNGGLTEKAVEVEKQEDASKGNQGQNRGTETGTRPDAPSPPPRGETV